MATEMKGALQSDNVGEFISAVYGLNRERARALQDKVATAIAEQEFFVVPQPLLDPVLILHPLFGCDLVKAMRKKVGDLTEKIAAQPLVVKPQEKKTAHADWSLNWTEQSPLIVESDLDPPVALGRRKLRPRGK